MKTRPNRGRSIFLAMSFLVVAASFCAVPVRSTQDSQQATPDNTKANKDQTNPSADKQKMNASDRAMTQKIRKSIQSDKSLSTYAHNIKIITQNGKVTLRGPVRSEEEKTDLQAKAVEVAGQENVTNELTIAPAK